MFIFKDHFSKQSASYRKYRPEYPPLLFDYLRGLTVAHDLAWDCGTGNGQSAIHLAGYYSKVYATDPSAQQIDHAMPHPAVQYKVEPAEKCGLEDHSVDLITVAQALHWFRFDDFFREAKRVLKTDGVLAVWCYGLPSFSAKIDKVMQDFHDHIVGEYWQLENKLIDTAYSTIPFPFEQVKTVVFEMQKEMDLEALFGLLHSWSAVQRYKDAKDSDPVHLIEQQLVEWWGDPQNKKTARWKLTLTTAANRKN